MTKWHKSTCQFHIASLIDPRSPTTLLSPRLQRGKRKGHLQETLLANLTDADDIPDTPTFTSLSLQFPPLTTEEVKTSILRAVNTALSPNEISKSILRHAWPLIKDHVVSQFTGFLSRRHHPIYFHRVIIVIRKKPKNLDLSSPRLYHLIALLIVLGKRLERLLGKFLA